MHRQSSQGLSYRLRARVDLCTMNTIDRGGGVRRGEGERGAGGGG